MLRWGLKIADFKLIHKSSNTLAQKVITKNDCFLIADKDSKEVHCYCTFMLLCIIPKITVLYYDLIRLQENKKFADF